MIPLSSLWHFLIDSIEASISGEELLKHYFTTWPGFLTKVEEFVYGSISLACLFALLLFIVFYRAFCMLLYLSGIPSLEPFSDSPIQSSLDTFKELLYKSF